MKDHLDNCPKCSSELTISRLTCETCGTEISGKFTGCTFCSLSEDDRMFAIVFIQTEGNMKSIERLMGISYPTIKSRIARLNVALGGRSRDYENSSSEPDSHQISESDKKRILDLLANKKITPATASALLRGDIDLNSISEKGENNE